MLDEKYSNIAPDKRKFKLKRKEKHGGTTNKEKRKNHPLEMLRPKKNRTKVPMKQLRKNIRNLRNKIKTLRYGQQRQKHSKQKRRR